MTPHYADDAVTLHHGDCLDVLRTLADNSVDAVVTDPPYGIGFMGHAWDQPGEYGAVRRNGKPGPHTRRANVDHTRTTTRDGSMEAGRYDLSLTANRRFQAWCEAWLTECLRVLKPGGHLLCFGGSRTWHRLAAAAEDAGFELRDSIAWLFGSGFPKSHNLDGEHAGWGTALKPAFEPIVVGRKPLAGTVAGNVLAHGTGALHIDACRTPAGQDYRDKCASVVGLASNGNGDAYGKWTAAREDSASDLGRWPTNVLLDDTQAAQLDQEVGPLRARPGQARAAAAGTGWGMTATGAEYADSGGPSRFFPTFRYEAKAPAAERPRDGDTAHPTVKPLDLMRWLVRLVTPPGRHGPRAVRRERHHRRGVRHRGVPLHRDRARGGVPAADRRAPVQADRPRHVRRRGMTTAKNPVPASLLRGRLESLSLRLLRDGASPRQVTEQTGIPLERLRALAAEQTHRPRPVRDPCLTPNCGQPKNPGAPRHGWVQTKAAGDPHALWWCSWTCAAHHAADRAR